jgi:aminoglycoside 3-N-acetyltransferase
MSSESALTRDDIARGLRELGLTKGDSLIVHSSMRHLGPVEGGADTVIDAILEVIGPTGNLVLPTFNYVQPVPLPYYDPGGTPGRTGTLPEVGRKRPQAVRSLHPTHSVAVIGPAAERLTAGHLSQRVFGVGSPVDLLAQGGGKVLLLGVGQTSNSTIHVAEEHAGMPKGPWTAELPVVKIRRPDGTFLSHQLDTSCSCSAAFEGAEYALRSHGEIRDARIGGGCRLMLGRDVIRRVVDMIRQKPDILLCRWEHCPPCTVARRRLAAGGLLPSPAHGPND